MDGPKQMLWNIFCALVRPARKMSLFSSIITTIILSYGIIRIYTILHIYLQVSETKGLEEMHWVIALSVLEKIKSIYFQGISLVLSRIFFQETECAFKNPRGFISNLIIWNLSKSLFYIQISTKKQAFDFFKRNSYTNAFWKFLCNAKLITSLIII